MRKILNKNDGEKERKRNTLIIGIFLIIIMMFSTVGYAFYSSDRSSDSQQTTEYNGVEFKQTNYGSWIFEIEGYNFETTYNPLDTENISVITSKNIQNYQNRVLYLGINSGEDIFQVFNNELISNLDPFIPRSNFACIDNTCSEDYPIKKCTEENIIILVQDQGGFTRVIDQGDCQYVYSSSQDLTRVADALLFKILGIQ